MNYEYMKEYPCNGKKPDLPDDVRVEIFINGAIKARAPVSWLTWSDVQSFRIVDDRYKPEHHIPDVGKKIKSDWFERRELPPVGEVVEFSFCGTAFFNEPISERWKDGDELEVLAHKGGEAAPVAVVWNKRDRYATCLVSKVMRPLHTERDELIDRAKAELPDHIDIIGNWSHTVKIIEILADAGMLKMPERDNG